MAPIRTARGGRRGKKPAGRGERLHAERPTQGGESRERPGAPPSARACADRYSPAAPRPPSTPSRPSGGGKRGARRGTRSGTCPSESAARIAASTSPAFTTPNDAPENTTRTKIHRPAGSPAGTGTVAAPTTPGSVAVNVSTSVAGNTRPARRGARVDAHRYSPPRGTRRNHASFFGSPGFGTNTPDSPGSPVAASKNECGRPAPGSAYALRLPGRRVENSTAPPAAASTSTLAVITFARWFFVTKSFHAGQLERLVHALQPLRPRPATLQGVPARRTSRSAGVTPSTPIG